MTAGSSPSELTASNEQPRPMSFPIGGVRAWAEISHVMCPSSGRGQKGERRRVKREGGGTHASHAHVEWDGRQVYLSSEAGLQLFVSARQSQRQVQQRVPTFRANHVKPTA